MSTGFNCQRKCAIYEQCHVVAGWPFISIVSEVQQDMHMLVMELWDCTREIQSSLPCATEENINTKIAKSTTVDLFNRGMCEKKWSSWWSREKPYYVSNINLRNQRKKNSAWKLAGTKGVQSATGDHKFPTGKGESTLNAVKPDCGLRLKGNSQSYQLHARSK